MGKECLNQEQIEELEKKALAGDANAMLMFGALLIVDGYYENGKDFLSQAAKKKNARAQFWLDIHEKWTKALASIKADVLNPLQIPFWNIRKGNQPESFGILPLADGMVLVLIKQDTPANAPANFAHVHTETIMEKYFHTMIHTWNFYVDGELKMKDIKPTKNTKYLISIMHYMLENYPELRWI